MDSYYLLLLLLLNREIEAIPTVKTLLLLYS